VDDQLEADTLTLAEIFHAMFALDPRATLQLSVRLLPADYQFSGADQGVHTFTLTLDTLGSQTVTVTCCCPRWHNSP
jgi:hypothetical protein